MVVFDSVFPLENVFRLMMDDEGFDPYIVVIPDVSRGSGHQNKTMCQTFDVLARKYGERVLTSLVGGRFIDISRSFDLYAATNPYSQMTHRFYRIPYLAMKGCLVFATRYFTDTGTIYSTTFNSLNSLAFLWRFYAEDDRDAHSMRMAQPLLRRRNAIIAVGRPKMDTYKPAGSRHSRKCIILAPHHSIDPIGSQRFTIANFPMYADFFLQLPERYPNVDWVFRPHPLLFTSMLNSGRWTQAQCDAYIAKMRSYVNVQYETGGEYLDTFAKSDGMIQDCSSFLPEYFYTGMPQCYLLRSKESVDEQFLEYGKLLLSHTYKAYSESDVLSFIDDVIINGNDVMKEERLRFLNANFMYACGKASMAIIDDIKRTLGLCNEWSEMSVQIHPLSDVTTSKIGDGTRIWQFTVVLDGARIGTNCNICAQTFIESDVVLGDNVTVKCGVQLWNGLRVGNNVFIGPNVTFCNDKHPRSGNRGFACLQTIIEDDVSIGANATILPGVRLGRGCVIGAGAVVTKDVGPGTVVAGNPAKELER